MSFADDFQSDDAFNWREVMPQPDGMHALHRLYDEHDYVGVVRGCEALLKAEPDHRAAKKLKWMAKRRLTGHEFKVGMAVLCMALFVAVGSISFMNKKVVHELQVKDFQVSSLVDEVGELRGENLLLFRYLEDNGHDLTSIQGSLLHLQDRVENADGLTVLGLQEQLQETQTKLSSQSGAVSQLVAAGLKRANETAASSVSPDDTLDVLVLGTHGRLTDTILLASINPAKKTVSLFSIPRDLTVNGRRINEYYYRFGIDQMRKKIQEITGLYPEKYVVIDLAAFERVIDGLDGIDVNVTKALFDGYYPGPHSTYQAFSVSAGLHHMDGKMALKYARSRKSTSDFDRAERQQQIMEAVRDRAKALHLIKDMNRLVTLYSSVMESLDTDVDLLDFVSYVKMVQDYEIERGNVLTSSDFLYSTIGSDGAYLLLPRDASYQQIRDYVAKVVRE